MAKPSVVFYNRTYPPARGATGRVLRDLARAFVRDGWNVTVVTAGPKAGKDRDGAIRVIRVKAGKGKSLFSYGMVWLKMLLTGLALPRPAMVVTMTDPPLLVVAGRIIASWKKCRHMHWCQDLYPDLLPALGVRLPNRLMKSFTVMSRRAMKRCDKVVVIGRCMAKYLTHSGVDPRRITVIPNWPDQELTVKGESLPGTQSKAMIPKAEGARSYKDLFKDQTPKFRVLYSGNLGRAHPVQTILEAASILNKICPDVEFVFVGDGPQYSRLAQERARRGLDNIRFLPWQPANRLKELMESGDLHLITMTEHAAGLLVPSKLYSALAVGRPCVLIGPEGTEASKVLSDFKAGIVVPQGQPRQLAQAIRTFRLNSDAWFSAHEGAQKAGRIFVPDEAINAWVERARNIAMLPPHLRKQA